MQKNDSKTVTKVSELIKPTVEEQGVKLWDVRFVKEGASWYLRVFIDKDGGVGIDDCEKVSRAIDPILDENDPIGVSYCLEVSSPGLERELIKEEHFQSFLGSDVFVKLIRPLENIGRELSGKLVASDKDTYTLSDDDGQTLTISKKDTVFVKLDDFNM